VRDIVRPTARPAAPAARRPAALFVQHPRAWRRL